MPAPSGYTSRLPTDVILDVGVLRVEIGGVATVVGVSRGGLRFDPGISMKEVDYDGRRAPIVGGDRITFRRPTFAGTMLLAGPEDLRLFEPAAGGTGSAPGTVTPKPAGTPFVIGEYLKNVSLTFARSGSATATAVINFPYGLCTKYEIGSTDENEGEVPITIEARLDRADVANNDLTVPYTITYTD
jgi:hypothetical protein